MNKQQKEVAFRLDFYRMTPQQMSSQIRDLLDFCPTYTFESLRSCKTLPQVFYVKSDSSYSHAEVLMIHTISPKGGQATVSRWPNQVQTKIYKGNYYYKKFYALTSDLIQLLGITHEEIVKTALADGYKIPVQIRILYPEMFVELPDGIDKERLRKALSPDFVRLDEENGIYTTPETIVAAIENEHAAIKRWMQLNSLFVKEPNTEDAQNTIADRERIAQDHFHNIEFYRWLLPLVQPGAVFRTEKKLCNEPAYNKNTVVQKFVI